MRARRAGWFLLAIFLLVGGPAILLGAAGAFRSPEAALAAFVAPGREVGEDQIAVPLLITGSRSVPIVAAAVKDRQLPYRRYALGYLGWAGDSRALPSLAPILDDSTELDYFRADALEGIACIDKVRGDSLSRQYSADTGILGWEAREVLAGSGCRAKDRSFWDVLFGGHD
jgi:HEAT repeat protein